MPRASKSRVSRAQQWECDLCHSPIATRDTTARQIILFAGMHSAAKVASERILCSHCTGNIFPEDQLLPQPAGC